MSNAISVLGSTGSIGTQTLQVAKALGIRVVALAAKQNITLLEEQARCFRPQLIAVFEDHVANDLKVRLADTDIRVVSGMEGLSEAATMPDADTVVTALVGMIGLRPTLAAIEAHKRIALANKETLVCAGALVMERARQNGVDIVPVDSEHSAIFQCLQGISEHKEIKRLILTASGGPFFGRSRDQLTEIVAADALKHPNWNMGAKVTVDSATLMNKGLELIEAMHLYHLPPEKIQIVIHRQSIIHSLVEFCDNALLAQLGAPDMRVPIQYALTWPKRCKTIAKPLDLLAQSELTFAMPDLTTFRCLALATKAAKRDDTSGAILNGANEAAVSLFLEGKIGFLDIADCVERAMDAVCARADVTLQNVLEADRMARDVVYKNFRTRL